MQKNISFIEIACLVKELQILKDAKIDKVFLNPEQDLLLQVHLPNTGKKILRLHPPHFFYLSEYRADTPEKPSGFCMFLRKQLENTRIKSIEQINAERIIAITFQGKDETFTLYTEYFSKGNIIFCNEKNIILAAYDQQEWKDRTIKVDLEYQYPKKATNFFTLKKEQLTELINDTDKESIVKLLALDLGLGGLYAEELCLKANINKTKKQLSDNEITALYNEIKHLRSLPIKPFYVIDMNELVPFDLALFHEKQKKLYLTFNELLDTELTNILLKHKQSEHSKKASKKKDEVLKIMAQQEEHIGQITKLINENQQKAEHIYNNYQLIDSILKEMQKAREKYSWKEIKEKVKGHKLIKSINEKENEITVEI